MKKLILVFAVLFLSATSQAGQLRMNYADKSYVAQISNLQLINRGELALHIAGVTADEGRIIICSVNKELANTIDITLGELLTLLNTKNAKITCEYNIKSGKKRIDQVANKIYVETNLH